MLKQEHGRRFIGQILIDSGFLPRQSVQAALEEQKNTNERLGQILVRMHILDPSDFQVALSVQEHLDSAEEAAKIAAGVRQLLGDLLVQAGRITREQLEHAIAEQKRSGAKLGEVLIRQGLLTERELRGVLGFQQYQGAPKPVASPLRLGEILVSSGIISRDQLEDALRKQTGSQKKLGEVLVEEGYAKPHHITRGMRLQQMLVTAVLVALLAACGSSLAQTATEEPASTNTVTLVADRSAAPADGLTIQKRNWFKRFFFKPNWAQALSECASPEDVCRMVEKHIAYKEEAVDQWASAKETWERGYGDCEDFAVCIQTMCRELGFSVSVQLYYTLSPTLVGHAIVTGVNSDGSLWLASNGSFERVGSSQEIADRVADIMSCDVKRMWSVMLADAEVDRLVSKGSSLDTIGAPPVAVSAQ